MRGSSKKKVIKKTRSELYLLNRKFMGDEPSYESSYTTGGEPDLNTSNVSKLLTWYTYMCDKNDAREYFEEYLTSINAFESLEKVKKTSDRLLPLTAAWMARILYHNKLSSSVWKNKILIYIENAYNLSSKTVTEKLENEMKLEVAEKTETKKEDGSFKAWEIIEEVHSFDLNVLKYNMYERLQGSNLSQNDIAFICSNLQSYREKTVSDYEYLIKEKSTNKTKKNISAFSNHILKMIEDLNSYAGIKKAARKPRKKKALTADKILKHFKYCNHDPELKVSSVQPEKILGAKELWCFNTKYKIISVYRSEAGLSIDRMSITNYDTNTSEAKTVGHRKEEAVKSILAGTKAAVKKSFNEIKGKTREINPRINENVLLLRVF